MSQMRNFASQSADVAPVSSALSLNFPASMSQSMPSLSASAWCSSEGFQSAGIGICFLARALLSLGSIYGSSLDMVLVQSCCTPVCTPVRVFCTPACTAGVQSVCTAGVQSCCTGVSAFLRGAVFAPLLMLRFQTVGLYPPRPDTMRWSPLLISPEDSRLFNA